MAYSLFQHQTATSQPTGLVSAESSSLKTLSSFDQTEQSVIVLSRNDPWLSLADPLSFKVRLLRCFGYKLPNRLADGRLEALRRHAVILRLRGPADDNDLRNLFEAGFAAGQAARLEQMVAPWRCRSHAGSAALSWSTLGLASGLIPCRGASLEGGEDRADHHGSIVRAASAALAPISERALIAA